MCPHLPTCPAADRPDRAAAHTVALHPGQGWSLLCNGVIVFDDLGEILPDGRAVPPHRPARSPLPRGHSFRVKSRTECSDPWSPTSERLVKFSDGVASRRPLHNLQAVS